MTLTERLAKDDAKRLARRQEVDTWVHVGLPHDVDPNQTWVLIDTKEICDHCRHTTTPGVAKANTCEHLDEPRKKGEICKHFEPEGGHL